jgi:ribosome-binding factor A
LGKRIEMRRIPEIIFKDDVVFDKGLSVLKLLDELKHKNQNNNFEEKDANS